MQCDNVAAVNEGDHMTAEHRALEAVNAKGK